ncbi:GntR family transcriptional regulator [Pseudolysinimonas sp.]|uniref:GntR family transcriptional regulator n=1 Tax=Pseudolysinimonas sp. TaxID=2680009 RepID=UPI003F7EB296
MQIDVDPRSEVPLYQQLRDRIVESIADGSLPEGTALASVRQVAGAFGINLATVAKGYDLLRQEGFVRTNRRSGSVVARDASSGPPPAGFAAHWEPRLRTLVAEAVAQGMDDDAVSAAVASQLRTLRSGKDPR